LGIQSEKLIKKEQEQKKEEDKMTVDIALPNKV